MERRWTTVVKVQTHAVISSICQTNDLPSATGQSPTTASTIPYSSLSDGNPRSPKRRRLSPVNDEDKSGDATLSQATRDAPTTQKGEVSKIEDPAVKQQSHTPSVATAQIQPQNPAVAVRLEHLPALDTAAYHVLAFLARLTPADALGLARAPDSPSSREYAALRSQFEYTRRFYNTGAHFLSAKDTGLEEKTQIDTLRKANQAIFVSSVFTGEIGLRDMDRSFLSVFVPEGGKLLKPQGSMYLELKTQGFITAWRTGAAPPAVVMSDLFGPDIDKSILSRRPGVSTLALSEQDFLNRLSSRREILQTHIQNNTLNQLPEKYKWEDFSREVSSYLFKNIENPLGNADGTTAPPRSEGVPIPPQGQMEGQFSIHGTSFPPGSRESFASPATASTTLPASGLPFQDDDFVAQAARAAEIAMQGAGGVSFAEQLPATTSTPPSNQGTNHAAPNMSKEYQHYDPAMERASARSLGENPSSIPSEIPHVSQTAPTSVLYERARLAATTKALAARKGTSPSQRRPWTTEEENTLMAGLDRVKGPHWSQILAMYGPGGTINEALKDRNQVQLKDKARNLKLFFLKSGIEVPYYLKYVTGDLKTRAPGHPNKQESKEQENGQGFMALDEIEQEALATGSSGSRSGRQSPAVDDFEEPTPAADIKKPFEPSMDDVSVSPKTTTCCFDHLESRLEIWIPFSSNYTNSKICKQVEAMIARAAAQASQSLGSTWP
ncbi:uncharacterized protein A1O9_10943 [Exophiala aquamarina CBS 119918]|uniref:HTH myb-type domain-containing protein n=1 Tax=Exophiala aquamarina CBS 119918 TaxID=1182545 RepID=A0A072PBS0_9EURO|nr:uncharacterized protein A1O9_10943 [Exophiala aquamarina CBS 119918]KEF53035.1 hypothetical protein A1O9_10943 [Exophiala aquamarina CBS 119918]